MRLLGDRRTRWGEVSGERKTKREKAHEIARDRFLANTEMLCEPV
jgi:hypothetical protein